MKVQIQSWQKNSAGLIDYERSDISNQKFKITQSQTILQNRTEAFLHPIENKIMPENTRALATIVANEERVSL